ncbi:O-antigen translocase [Microvirga puerhi]|uniref:O-antigen translocase n=1 Tax=Microvirga puerhi TaxID=2876078 RepID=A0ABS7VUZ2_9HYPH|nr:O-antigen translocase [Microvirga puerhi]MBZ6079385.1 O-antigen translocase [Microvirga puerhi]
MSPSESSKTKQTYTQILKSTAQIGGSSVVNIAFGIIRNKALALILGPSGVGLMGLYNSVADLTQSFSGLGVQSSGVRQIAEAAGTENEERIATTAIVLRRISFFLGLFGACLLLTFAVPISNFTFGSNQHAFGVALLAIVVFFKSISAGQTALVQGMRRISDLARISILAALFSTIIGLPIIYLFGEQGIVPSLIAMAAVSILTSWWYSRKVEIRTRTVSIAEMWPETVQLLKLGVAFMASGFLTLGAAYAVRIIVLHSHGIDAAGLYQASWVLGGLYAGFILQAMGADFYPRLTAAANDNGECNRLVNEQAQISILLAGPGVIATLTFAPAIMTLFYSSAFYPAISLLRWICLGMMLRIVSWPMGFIVLAKGAQKVFFWMEVAATCIHVGAAWLLVSWFGLDGAGAAFLILYIWHSFLTYIVAHHLSGFRWSPDNIRLVAIFLPTVTLVFCSFLYLPVWIGVIVGSIALICTGLFSVRTLLAICPPDLIPASIRPWVVRVL